MARSRLSPLLDSLTVREHLGIGLVDSSRSIQTRPAFLARTTEALDLLKRVDPRRLRRVRSQLKCIVHTELPFAYARYDKHFQSCCVDFTRLDFDRNPEIMIWGYAAILVHEATHGAIQAHGIRYSRKTRDRIERLCDAEAARFLLLHSKGAATAWSEIMNRPGRRERLWSKTRWQRWGALWRRKFSRNARSNPPYRANRRQPFSSDENRTSQVAAYRRSR
jgi:hypothetical protein